jgi:hypothetical protein
MKTTHLLLGGAERRLNSVIEATVLDVCYNRAAVETTRVFRLGEFVRNGSSGSFEIMILVADHLLPETKLGEPGPDALIQAVWMVKSRSNAPLFVLGTSPEIEYRLLEAGADAVLSNAFDAQELRSELERLLALPEPRKIAETPKWSFTAIFGRSE